MPNFEQKGDLEKNVYRITAPVSALVCNCVFFLSVFDVVYKKK